MKLHYLYSDQKRVRAATIRFNGEVQKNCTYVDDEKGYIVRREAVKDSPTWKNVTHYGQVEIEIQPVGKFPYYKTPERNSNAN